MIERCIPGGTCQPSTTSYLLFTLDDKSIFIHPKHYTACHSRRVEHGLQHRREWRSTGAQIQAPAASIAARLRARAGRGIDYGVADSSGIEAA